MAFYMIHILKFSTVLKKVTEKRVEREKEVYK